MSCFAFVDTNAVLVRKIDNPPLNRKEPIRNQIHIGFFGQQEYSTREQHLLCFGFIILRRQIYLHRLRLQKLTFSHLR
jgi:hypothetical protein